MFEWIEELMEATGCDWETAARMYDSEHNPDYNPDDYDDPEGCNACWNEDEFIETYEDDPYVQDGWHQQDIIDSYRRER